MKVAHALYDFNRRIHRAVHCPADQRRQLGADPERRQEADVPKPVQFQTKPQIALAQIRQAVEDRVPPGVVLADEVYGSSHEFREGVAERKLLYSLAVRSTTTVERNTMDSCFSSSQISTRRNSTGCSPSRANRGKQRIGSLTTLLFCGGFNSSVTS